MLEYISEFFYDPVVFWTAPLALVALAAVWRRLRAWGRRRFLGATPGNDKAPPHQPGAGDVGDV